MDAVMLDDALTSPGRLGPGETPLAPEGARTFRLPGGVLLLDVPADPGMAVGPGDVLLDGVPLAPPSCTLLLHAAGAMRHLTVARHPAAERRHDEPVFTLLRRGIAGAPPFRAAWGNARDFALAANDLPPLERAGLLRFLVGTCAPILRVAGHPGFASLLHAIARGLAPATAPCAQPLTRIAGSLLSLWTVPGGVPEGPWHLLTPRRVTRVPAPVADTLLLDSADDLGGALLLPPPGSAGEPRRPLPLAAPRRVLPTLLAPAGPDGGPDHVSAALARRAAAGEERTVRLLRHRRLLVPALPVRALDDPARPVGGALELALSDGAGGVFVSGWLRDPFGLAEGGLALRDPRTGATVPIPPDAFG
ncbi:hypothetical protein ACE7GA_01140 [Roseomonas sp. CCTCC AB2023176]|uniref:hypothetical protein n=1 Tax=Roseomonas sp. CCTCC AB2023176 TaxID=3342640 RepID=UPI0035D7331C